MAKGDELVCPECGAAFIAKTRNQKYHTPVCRLRAKLRRYQASDNGKVVQKRYQASDKRKAVQKRYRGSDKGKVANRRYDGSDKRRATDRKKMQRRRRESMLINAFSVVVQSSNQGGES